MYILKIEKNYTFIPTSLFRDLLTLQGILCMYVTHLLLYVNSVSRMEYSIYACLSVTISDKHDQRFARIPLFHTKDVWCFWRWVKTGRTIRRITPSIQSSFWRIVFCLTLYWHALPFCLITGRLHTVHTNEKIIRHNQFRLLNRVHISRGVARISRRGGSKLVPTKTIGLKSLLRTYKTLVFMLRKQKTSWLPLSERVYHFLDIYVSVVIDVHQRQPRLSLA